MDRSFYPPAGEDPFARAEEPSESDVDGTFADVFNGFTLDSGRNRKLRKKGGKKGRQAQQDGVAPAGAAEEPATSPADQGDPMTAMTSPPDSPDALPRPPGGLFDAVSWKGTPAFVPEPAMPVEESAAVRPYAITGGRTKSNYALELETLISTQDGIAAGGMLPPAANLIENRSIMEECRTPRSVAEIAALLRLPLGVARVLISDAADAGLVVVHKTMSGYDGAEAHLVLMERVLSGLRRL